MTANQKIATRNAFGEEICALGKSNPAIYVIDADISKSCKTDRFAAEYPNQHVNVGIAEQNAAGIAAGLATTGKIPFVATYAVFGSLRMTEQVRQEICYPNLNVKIACSHGGLTPANDGASHQGVEDLGVMRSIPGMTVIMPADYYAAKALVRAAAEFYGPVYLRFTRDAVPVMYDEHQRFEIGKAVTYKRGKDVAIIANGDTLCLAVKAASLLEQQNIDAEVIDMHTVKPIDREKVKEVIERIGKIVTVEDHNIINGLGSAVCEIVAESGNAKVKRIGINDCFGQSAPYERLLSLNGITASNIAQSALELIG